MNLSEYILLAASSLFVIVDPVATVPAFLAMTPTDTFAQRAKMARLACVLATIVLLTFAIAGKYIFHFLGITMPAFQIAASIVLLIPPLATETVTSPLVPPPESPDPAATAVMSPPPPPGVAAIVSV